MNPQEFMNDKIADNPETAVHPVLGTGPEWEVTNFMGTVELRNRKTGATCGIPKPYDPQSPAWWRGQVAAAIAKARS